ncbi:MAG: hypothetical protein WCJ37_00770 [Syntrophus sp. (in: bacteria)]
MSEDFRFKMQHLGDIFVDTLSTVVDSAKKHAKGIVLTYDIHDLKKKKLQCLSMIGRRIVQVKTAGLADLKRDDNLVELITQAEKIDRYIESFEEKKKMMTCGWQGKTV